ncbi:MAG: prolyl oligopeptidase family serine peptidase [Polyangiales bacterium]|nr:S9 family peptidase [Sandaracinus sp.]MCB9622325.1 S9 family peptidase [Sandaracinus sp.]
MRRALPFLLVAACHGTPETAAVPTDPHADLHDVNRRAREAGATVDTLFGVQVADPFRALETESEITTAWVSAQHARSAEALEIRPAIRERLATLFEIGSIGRVSVGGDRVFYERREGDAQQPRTFVRVGDAEHLLLDPTTFGERAALDWAVPSPDGTKLAFGISQNGDERSVLHVLDVDAAIAGRDAVGPLRIARTKWCNLAWLPDGSGFYYTRYPKPGEEGFDAENEDAYFPRVFFHALGGDGQDDPRVFGANEGTDFPIPTVSDDGRWLVVNVFRGWSASDVHLLDRHAQNASFVPVIAGEEALTTGVVSDGGLYLMTNLDAPKYRIARVPVAQAADRAAWRDVVPETDAPIEHWALVGDQIAIHYVADVMSKLVLARRDGSAIAEVVLPGTGAIGTLAGEAGHPLLAFVLEGYLRPPTLLTIDTAAVASRLPEGMLANATRELYRVQADFDFDAYEERRVKVRSADGTEVPVTLLHRRGVETPARTILYGYGGFNVSLLPTLSRSALSWIERGNVYAVANLRGGAEYGEAWHRAGMRENKQRVFEDFEGVIAWLAESGLSTPDRIGITGGSNGGLLMGAMITRVPERFGAAASYVGLYDMVRYHRFPPAELWISEYGSADESREQLEWLLAYSPYHRVVAGTRYPAVWLETADHDSRVHWAHTTKLAAALQEATTSNRPIYFWMERQVGHGAGTRTSDAVEKYARMYSFFESELTR